MALASQGDNVSLTFGGTAPSGYAVSGYETSAGTLTGTENPYTLQAMPNADVTITALYGPADWETLNEGTEDDPYLIFNTGQWDLLSTRVNSGTGYSGKVFKLMDDISVNHGGRKQRHQFLGHL